jgi:histone acetyltransferase (RNA polymerase elongator complex component)
MQIRHFTIPIFIPQLACPNDCVFCNQRSISGFLKEPSAEEILEIVTTHLATIPSENSYVEIGFFGGSFTGLQKRVQENYLKIVQPFLESGLIRGIRLSTRPDYIDEDILELLKKYHVTTIELGAQSMDDEVLKLSGRGHTSEQVIAASHLIKQNGFSLGLQTMLGLPGDTLEKSIATAKAIVALGADNTRIYPTLVITETDLENLYNKGKYSPLSLDDAVEWTKEVYKIFEQGNVKILRIGLHPSEGLISGKNLVAGPFHVSFGELVMSALWNETLKSLLKINLPERSNVVISINPGQINNAIGHGAQNKIMLQQKFNNVKFITDPLLEGRNFHVNYC